MVFSGYKVIYLAPLEQQLFILFGKQLMPSKITINTEGAATPISLNASGTPIWSGISEPTLSILQSAYNRGDYTVLPDPEPPEPVAEWQGFMDELHATGLFETMRQLDEPKAWTSYQVATRFLDGNAGEKDLLPLEFLYGEFLKLLSQTEQETLVTAIDKYHIPLFKKTQTGTTAKVNLST